MKKIPKKFYPYFRDVDPRKIDLQKNDKYVVERLLEWGGFASLKWLLKTYGLKKIIFIFKNARGLSRRTVNFYRYLFNLKERGITMFPKTVFPEIFLALRKIKTFFPDQRFLFGRRNCFSSSAGSSAICRL